MATTATRLGALGMLTALVVGACSGGFGGASATPAASSSRYDPARGKPASHTGAERERGGGARQAHLLRRRQQRHGGAAQGPDRRLHRAPPERHDRDRDAPRRHRGRQPRQDAPRDRRHARHVLLQLGLAAAGAEPGGHARRPQGPAVHRQHPGDVPADGVRERRHLRRPDRGHARAAASSTTRRSTATSGSRCPRPGPSSRPTTTRSRRPARPRPSARPTGTPGPRSCSCWPTTTTSRRQIRTSPTKYTANQAKYADTPAALAGFQHLQEAFDKGWYQKDFGADKFDKGQELLANGEVRPLPDADLRRRHDGRELPGHDRRHRVLRPAGRRRRDQRRDDLDAGRDLHPQDDHRRPARRGQGVRELHRRRSRAPRP